jgi:hypothetical protein
MYCPNCGAESTFGLNYCKHCGGNLADTAEPAAPPPSKNIFAALILALAAAGIVLGGLGIVFTNALALVAPQPAGYSQPANDAGMIAGMMVIFGCSVIVLVSLMLIKLFARVMGFASATEKPSRRAKSFLAQQRVPQIPAPPIVVSSVTEHTTRNFEPRAYRRDASE